MPRPVQLALDTAQAVELLTAAREHIAAQEAAGNSPTLDLASAVAELAAATAAAAE